MIWWRNVRTKCVDVLSPYVLMHRRRIKREEYAERMKARHTAHHVIATRTDVKHSGILKDSKNGFANGHVNPGFISTEKPVTTSRAPRTVVKVTPAKIAEGRVLKKTSALTHVSVLSVPRAHHVNGTILPARAFKDNSTVVSQSVSVSSQKTRPRKNHARKSDAILKGPVHVYQAPARMVRLQPGSQPGKGARYVVVGTPAQDRWVARQQQKTGLETNPDRSWNVKSMPVQGKLMVVNSQNKTQGAVRPNVTMSEVDVRDVRYVRDVDDVVTEHPSKFVSSAGDLHLGALYLRWSPRMARRKEIQRQSAARNGAERPPESPDSFKIATNTLPMKRASGGVPSPIPTTTTKDEIPNVVSVLYRFSLKDGCTSNYKGVIIRIFEVGLDFLEINIFVGKFGK